MTEGEDRRWPRWLYGVGEEPDPRVTLANERTFLAWIRTGLGFLVAGVAVVTAARLSPGAPQLEIRTAAVLLVLVALLCAAGGYRRWLVVERAVRLSRPLPSTSVLAIVAAVLVVVAVGALVVVALR